jgi:D-alanyl-D-alanine carboxypeptidase (penicillin-binding protein 5/6)
MAKKHQRKHRLRRLATLLVIGLVLAGYVALALAQPLLSLQPTVSLQIPTQAASKVALNWPDYGESAIGAAGYGVLATSGSQKALPTASIAKVMTALAVLRQRPLQLNQQGPTITLGVALGEQITEYQALEAMLLPSANNMAETLARWAFGSIANYNTYANSYAKQLGLKSMHITDPSGYDQATVATARDLTLLGSLAMLNPVFTQIVAQPSASVPVAGTISNYNFMLGKDGNVGIKTGNNDGDKGAFLFASTQRVDNQLITVVGTIMGGPDLETVLSDSAPLTASATAGFGTKHFVSNGQKVGSYNVPGQGEVAALATDNLDLVTWNGISYSAVAHLKSLKPPLSANAQVGSVGITAGSSAVNDMLPVQLARPIERPTLVWRLTHPLGH